MGRPYKIAPDDSRIEDMLQMRREGASDREIGAKFGVSAHTVFRRIGGTRPRVYKTDDAQMRAMRASGATLREIGERFGVDPQVVRRRVGGLTNQDRRNAHVGTVYGRLTVVEVEPHGKTRCVCECGCEWTGQMRSLKGGVKSCGCLSSEPTAYGREDMTGKTVGRFTGVRFVRAGGRKGNGPVWVVRCERGHEFETPKKRWNRGETVCRECVADKRAELVRIHQERQARIAAEAAERREYRLVLDLIEKRVRVLTRELERWQKCHGECGGTHEVNNGHGRALSCEEYEVWRAEKSIEAGGDGVPKKTRRAHEFSPGQRQEIFERDGWACLACGSPDGLEADHVVPISHGGPSEVSNGQTLCAVCHAAKTLADSSEDFRSPRTESV